MLTNPPEHADARANPESAWEFKQHLRNHVSVHVSTMEINGIKSRCAQPRMTHISIYTCKGSLEIKLPTISTDGKAEVGRVREKSRREKVRQEKD